MTSLSLGFLIEILVAVLLVATIIYCLLVDRKLSRLREDQNSLKKTIQELHSSTHSAESAINNLKNIINTAETGLSEKIDAAEKTRKNLKKITRDADNLRAQIRALSQVKNAERAPSPVRQNNQSQNPPVRRAAIKLDPALRLSSLTENDREDRQEAVSLTQKIKENNQRLVS